MLEQHGSTCSSPLARHVERVGSCRDVTWRAKWNLGFRNYQVDWIRAESLERSLHVAFGYCTISLNCVAAAYTAIDCRMASYFLCVASCNCGQSKADGVHFTVWRSVNFWYLTDEIRKIGDHYTLHLCDVLTILKQILMHSYRRPRTPWPDT